MLTFHSFYIGSITYTLLGDGTEGQGTEDHSWKGSAFSSIRNLDSRMTSLNSHYYIPQQGKFATGCHLCEHPRKLSLTAAPVATPDIKWDAGAVKDSIYLWRDLATRRRWPSARSQTHTPMSSMPSESHPLSEGFVPYPTKQSLPSPGTPPVRVAALTAA